MIMDMMVMNRRKTTIVRTRVVTMILEAVNAVVVSDLLRCG
jgi:hypothetical protein